MLDLLGAGEVVSIDVLDRPGRPVHPRIRYVTGSSGDAELVVGVLSRKARGRVAPRDPRFGSFAGRTSCASSSSLRRAVPVGGYLVVEDSNVNGHPVLPDFGPGPGEAIGEFLAQPPGLRGGLLPGEVPDDVQPRGLPETGALTRSGPAAEVLRDFAAGVGARRARDSAAGMRARAAEVEAARRESGTAPSRAPAAS